MICQKCHKNNATIRYAEVISGKVSELMICPDCYAKMSETVSTGFEIAGEAPSPRRRESWASRKDEIQLQEACPSCGTSLGEVMEDLEIGCATCYEHFRDALGPVLEGLHASLEHRGKVLHTDDRRERVRKELQTKRALLKSAVEVENYEEAAGLRDAIRDLERTLNTVGGSADAKGRKPASVSVTARRSDLDSSLGAEE